MVRMFRYLVLLFWYLFIGDLRVSLFDFFIESYNINYLRDFEK